MFLAKSLGVIINFLLLLLMPKRESTLDAAEVSKFIAQENSK